MTKQEAVQIEKECDKMFSDALGTDCNVSMTLAGNFSVSFKSHFVNINKYDLFTVDWIKYIGDYDDLLTYIERIQRTISKNRAKIELLMQSYGMKFN